MEPDWLREGFRRGWATPFLAAGIVLLIVSFLVGYPAVFAVAIGVLGVVYLWMTTRAVKRRSSDTS
jgi:type III secretory pathway component EscV